MSVSHLIDNQFKNAALNGCLSKKDFKVGYEPMHTLT